MECDASMLIHPWFIWHTPNHLFACQRPNCATPKPQGMEDDHYWKITVYDEIVDPKKGPTYRVTAVANPWAMDLSEWTPAQDFWVPEKEMSERRANEIIGVEQPEEPKEPKKGETVDYSFRFG